MRIERGMVIDVDLNPTRGSETGKARPCVVVTNDAYNERVPVIQVVPITSWSEKKGRILTNVILEPLADNGLSKRSVADCLQVRPIDWRHRMMGTRGKLRTEEMEMIDRALAKVFGLGPSALSS